MPCPALLWLHFYHRGVKYVGNVQHKSSEHNICQWSSDNKQIRFTSNFIMMQQSQLLIIAPKVLSETKFSVGWILPLYLHRPGGLPGRWEPCLARKFFFLNVKNNARYSSFWTSVICIWGPLCCFVWKYNWCALVSFQLSLRVVTGFWYNLWTPLCASPRVAHCLSAHGWHRRGESGEVNSSGCDDSSLHQVQWMSYSLAPRGTEQFEMISHFQH